MRVLLAHSDRHSSAVLRDALSREGFKVDRVFNEVELFEQSAETKYDIILLVVPLMPPSFGLNALKTLRTMGYPGSIVSLFDGDDKTEMIQALNHGSDDCLAQPFSFAELVARLRAHGRRQNLGSNYRDNTLRVSPFEVDVLKREVRRGNHFIRLTRLEFELLVQFIRRPGHVLSTNVLVESVGLSTVGDCANTVSVHIKNLRSKIDVRGKNSFIRTERGCGYALNA